jgi:small multidrug resistance pump
MFISAWLILIFAIVLEVIGIAFMRLSDGLTRLWPTVGAAVFYLTSVVLIVMAAETIGIGVTYAVWSGMGTAMVAAMGWVVFGERITALRAVCISAIILGVVGLKLINDHSAASAADVPAIADEAPADGSGA